MLDLIFCSTTQRGMGRFVYCPVTPVVRLYIKQAAVDLKQKTANARGMGKGGVARGVAKGLATKGGGAPIAVNSVRMYGNQAAIDRHSPFVFHHSVLWHIPVLSV